jgi:hypothetical protein
MLLWRRRNIHYGRLVDRVDHVRVEPVSAADKRGNMTITRRTEPAAPLRLPTGFA